MKKVRIVILASGSGSNAESIIKHSLESNVYEVVEVITNKKNAMVVERAKKFNIPTKKVLKKMAETKSEYDIRLAKHIVSLDVDFVVLAGFMRLLSVDFLQYFKSKNIHYNVINIHPSLLPLFPGLTGYADAYEANVSESGCTIHFVDEGMDTGKIIYQEKFNKIPGESFEDFKNRGLSIENKCYPIVLENFFKTINL